MVQMAFQVGIHEVAVYRVEAPGASCQGLAFGHIPYVAFGVRASGCEAFPVGNAGNTVPQTLLPFEWLSQGFAVRHIPQDQCLGRAYRCMELHGVFHLG
jgi:hypothetical protein